MKRMEWIAAGVMLALAAVVFFATAHLAYMADFTPGPRFLPLWVVVAGVVLSVLLFIEASRRVDDGGVEFPDRDGLIRVGSTFAAIVGFAVLAAPLGFILAAALFEVVILMLVLRRPALQSAAATVITIGLVYLIFVSWLALPLPKGFLGI